MARTKQTARKSTESDDDSSEEMVFGESSVSDMSDDESDSEGSAEDTQSESDESDVLGQNLDDSSDDDAKSSSSSSSSSSSESDKKKSTKKAPKGKEKASPASSSEKKSSKKENLFDNAKDEPPKELDPEKVKEYEEKIATYAESLKDQEGFDPEKLLLWFPAYSAKYGEGDEVAEDMFFNLSTFETETAKSPLFAGVRYSKSLKELQQVGGIVPLKKIDTVASAITDKGVGIIFGFSAKNEKQLKEELPHFLKALENTQPLGKVFDDCVVFIDDQFRENGKRGKSAAKVQDVVDKKGGKGKKTTKKEPGRYGQWQGTTTTIISSDQLVARQLGNGRNKLIKRLLEEKSPIYALWTDKKDVYFVTVPSLGYAEELAKMKYPVHTYTTTKKEKLDELGEYIIERDSLLKADKVNIADVYRKTGTIKTEYGGIKSGGKKTVTKETGKKDDGKKKPAKKDDSDSSDSEKSEKKPPKKILESKKTKPVVTSSDSDSDSDDDRGKVTMTRKKEASSSRRRVEPKMEEKPKKSKKSFSKIDSSDAAKKKAMPFFSGSEVRILDKNNGLYTALVNIELKDMQEMFFEFDGSDEYYPVKAKFTLSHANTLYPLTSYLTGLIDPLIDYIDTKGTKLYGETTETNSVSLYVMDNKNRKRYVKDLFVDIELMENLPPLMVKNAMNIEKYEVPSNADETIDKLRKMYPVAHMYSSLMAGEKMEKHEIEQESDGEKENKKEDEDEKEDDE